VKKIQQNPNSLIQTLNDFFNSFTSAREEFERKILLEKKKKEKQLKQDQQKKEKTDQNLLREHQKKERENLSKN
jgi:hypothetical protein